MGFILSVHKVKKKFCVGKITKIRQQNIYHTIAENCLPHGKVAKTSQHQKHGGVGSGGRDNARGIGNGDT